MTKFNKFEKVTHVKSGKKYIIVGTPDKIRLESTNDEAYAYRDYNDTSAPIWIRSSSEMEDGRFVVTDGTSA